MRSDHCAGLPTVVIASERMDDEPGWEQVAVGELIHVGPDLVVEREIVLDGPPAHQMVLRGQAQESQSYERDA